MKRQKVIDVLSFCVVLFAIIGLSCLFLPISYSWHDSVLRLEQERQVMLANHERLLDSYGVSQEVRKTFKNDFDFIEINGKLYLSSKKDRQVLKELPYVRK